MYIFEDISSFKSRRGDVEDIFERFRDKVQRYIDNKDAIIAQVTQELEEELNIDTSKFEGILTEAQKKVKEEIIAKVEEKMLLEEIVIHFWKLFVAK